MNHNQTTSTLATAVIAVTIGVSYLIIRTKNQNIATLNNEYGVFYQCINSAVVNAPNLSTLTVTDGGYQGFTGVRPEDIHKCQSQEINLQGHI